MEHTEFLEKVKAVTKHQQEYKDAKTRVYLWMMLLPLLAVLLFPGLPYPYIFLSLSPVSGIIFLFKQEKARKEFREKFPEEIKIIDEYNKLLK